MKNKFALEYIVKKLRQLRSLEIRGLNEKASEPLNTYEQAPFNKMCSIVKPSLLHLKLDGIRFQSLRDLSLFLDELNCRILQTLDIKRVLCKPSDYENLEHFYYTVSKFKELRNLSLTCFEHKSVPNSSLLSQKTISTRMPRLQTIDIRLLAPFKLPSEHSLYLFLLVKDLVASLKALRSLRFEADYLLTIDQLRKVITGGAVPENERLTALTLEY